MEETNKAKVPEGFKAYLSKAYLVEVEPKTFGLFRDMVIEQKDARTGKVEKEKLRTVGPIGLFRECEGDERPDLESFHPVDQRPMRLKNIGEV